MKDDDAFLLHGPDRLLPLQIDATAPRAVATGLRNNDEFTLGKA